MLKNTVTWCIDNDLIPIIIDNNSNYKPLLDWYDYTDIQIIRLTENYGHTVLWQLKNTLDKLVGNDRYIVTDPDLNYTGIPKDFLSVLNKGLDKYPDYDKCGLSLEINDLPNTEEGVFIQKHEFKYWKNPLDDMYFHADTDTTFALYREGVREYNHNAIRTNRPYTCHHLSWYYTDWESMPEDEQHYFRTANESASGKKRMTIK